MTVTAGVQGGRTIQLSLGVARALKEIPSGDLVLIQSYALREFRPEEALCGG